MKTRSLITPAEPKGCWWGNDAIELRRRDGGGEALPFMRENLKNLEGTWVTLVSCDECDCYGLEEGEQEEGRRGFTVFPLKKRQHEEL